MSLLNTTIAGIRPLDPACFERAQAHLDTQTKPRGSLGTLEKIACQLAAIAEGKAPAVDPVRIYTCAGDHGVACHGVSHFPQEVTRQMVQNFMAGGQPSMS